MISRSDKILAVAEKIATHLFVIMLNPKYRGSNFSYANYDIEGHAVSMAGMSFERLLSDTEENKLKVRARRVWDELLEESDVESWIGSNQKIQILEAAAAVRAAEKSKLLQMWKDQSIIGKTVVLIESGERGIVERIYEDIPGGVRLKEVADGFVSWNVDSLRLADIGEANETDDCVD